MASRARKSRLPSLPRRVSCRSRVLHPAAGDDFDRADNDALVLPGKLNGVRVLLLSDLGRKGQNALLARTNDLRADVVIAGLTDDGEPLDDALLELEKQDAEKAKILELKYFGGLTAEDSAELLDVK